MADVNFKKLQDQFNREENANYDLTDDELRELLKDYPKDTPEAFAKIGAENYWD